MRNLLRLIVKHYFVLLFLVLEGVGLVLIFQFNPFHKSFVVNLSRGLSGNIGAKVSDIRDYLYLNEENLSINRENAFLKKQLQNLQHTVYLNLNQAGITDTLAVDFDFRYIYVPAEILNNSVNKQYNYITLNKGETDSIGADMAVVCSDGVVGMILSSSENFSTVQPIINRNSRTGAKIRGKDYFGIIEWDGRNPGRVQLKEIPIHVNLQVGDTIETSGYSSVYPKGQLIGSVRDIRKTEGNFFDVEVDLFVNFMTVNHVVVIKNRLQGEQRSVEGGEE